MAQYTQKAILSTFEQMLEEMVSATVAKYPQKV